MPNSLSVTYLGALVVDEAVVDDMGHSVGEPPAHAGVVVLAESLKLAVTPPEGGSLGPKHGDRHRRVMSGQNLTA